MLSIDRKANGQAYLFVGNQEIFYIQGISDASIDARQHSKYRAKDAAALRGNAVSSPSI